jgi:NAD(P)H-flavin reductase
VKDEIGISVKKVGKFTEATHLLNVGDKLGLRGLRERGFR